MRKHCCVQVFGAALSGSGWMKFCQQMLQRCAGGQPYICHILRCLTREHCELLPLCQSGICGHSLKCAVYLCRGRLKLVVTDVRSLQLSYIDDFATKEELIDANLASAHIPFFLDGRPFASYRCAASCCVASQVLYTGVA